MMRAIFALVLCLLVAVAQAKGELERDLISLKTKSDLQIGQPSGKEDERVPLTSAFF